MFTIFKIKYSTRGIHKKQLKKLNSSKDDIVLYEKLLNIIFYLMRGFGDGTSRKNKRKNVKEVFNDAIGIKFI